MVHVRFHHLQIIWKCLYSTNSGVDASTLYQLCNLINRRNVVKEPTDSVAASEDFIQLVVEAHILAAAMTVFNMKTLDDSPSHEIFNVPDEADSLQRRDVLLQATSLIVNTFVDITFAQGDEARKATKRRGKKSSVATDASDQDGVRAYASEVLNLGLLLMEFNDGVREGDGNRIIRTWRYLLLLFKANGHTNYSIEALMLLLQLQYLLSPRMAAQLKWNRTVNTHGRPGKNISSDLHMEHLNRECKNAMSSMGANVTDQSIQRVGRALKPLSETMLRFDQELGVPHESDYHTTRSSDIDLDRVLKQIFDESDVFSNIPGRAHTNFKQFVPNSMKPLSRKGLEQWVTRNANKILTCR